MTRANGAPTQRKSNYRPSGTGSIYRRGDRWEYARTLPNGKRATISAKTQEALVTRMEELDKPLRNHQPPAGKLTVASLLTQWLEDYEAQVNAGEKAPNTLRTYRILVRDHIVPTLGRTQAKALTTRQVNRWLTGLELADSTRRKCRAILVTALSWAETDEIVSRNVARTSKATARERVTESDFMTADECRRLREAIKGDRLEALYLLYLGAGLRRGEGLALAWSDVDFAAGTVKVRRSLTETPGGKPVLGEPKTISSARVARVLPFALEALRRRWDALDVVPLDLTEALVFLSTTGTAIFPNNLTRDFAIVSDRAGLGRRHVHELRHAYAAEMLRRGVPLHVVSRQLGHASITITADLYGHVEPTESAALLAVGETAFSEVVGQ